ncbi:GGDEF domain-containing protein [Bacillus sp. 1P06AnD]|uniref:GGDEF domain-containing protein n=1 Tax=Bacillus sp. 1P06AnD TaxID=3132208 RepID=UPI0039A17DA3
MKKLKMMLKVRILRYYRTLLTLLFAEGHLKEDEKKLIQINIQNSNFERSLPLFFLFFTVQIINIVDALGMAAKGENGYFCLVLVFSISFISVLCLWFAGLIYVVITEKKGMNVKRILSSVFWGASFLFVLCFSIRELMYSGGLLNFTTLVFIYAFIPLLSRTCVLLVAGVSTIVMVSSIIMLKLPDMLLYQVITSNIAFIIVSIIKRAQYISSVLLVAKLEATNQELKSLNEKLELLSESDPLTKLLNRRGARHRIDQLWEQFACQGKQIGLIVLDIDFFKHYNDRFGHAQGDNCLVAVAQCLQAVTEEGDIVGRYGGEEFCLVMQADFIEQVLKKAISLQIELKKMNLEAGTDKVSKKVTVSQGLGLIQPTTSNTFESLFEQGDENLYKAKSLGRNCIVYDGQVYTSDISL